MRHDDISILFAEVVSRNEHDNIGFSVDCTRNSKGSNREVRDFAFTALADFAGDGVLFLVSVQTGHCDVMFLSEVKPNKFRFNSSTLSKVTLHANVGEIRLFKVALRERGICVGEHDGDDASRIVDFCRETVAVVSIIVERRSH